MWGSQLLSPVARNDPSPKIRSQVLKQEAENDQRQGIAGVVAKREWEAILTSWRDSQLF